MDSPEEQAAIWPKVATDYHGALVRLATMRAAKKQYLLFRVRRTLPARYPGAGEFQCGGKAMVSPQLRGRRDACGFGFADVRRRSARLVTKRRPEDG